MDTRSIEFSTASRARFFELNYTALREQPSMKWMGRLFTQLTDGRHPSLVDLPTGAGKTDVTVVWILALAWYGLDSRSRKPVPRRLVWVVNRRVLVQQVFRLADELEAKLAAGNGALSELREGLASLSGDTADIFRFVQLRGQLVDDREWSIAPSVPQLIIGTVDQIGSRLLFQGYGLGKWSRPLQAGLLAVDAWVCVDEAHLVPEFLLTLRRVRQLLETTDRESPATLSPIFSRLPFWATELSATPSLPPPSADSVFRLNRDDEDDPQLRDRLIAARTRQVKFRWLTVDHKPEQLIGEAAERFTEKNDAVAVFVREAGVANRIAKRLRGKFKGRVLAITGRLRGYERDRIERDPVFRRFRPPQEAQEGGEAKETVFLVGTAAAEVGLDADASAVICDFASLPTLLQRLGRLDRRGSVSRRFHAGECNAPTMAIFAGQEVSAPDIRRRMIQLAQALRAELPNGNNPSASLLVGVHWNNATSKQATTKKNGAEPSDVDVEEVQAAGSKKPKRVEPAALVNAATRRVLLGVRVSPLSGSDARPPCTWLKHRLAPVTGGPVAVPPLTTALVQHWSATTSPHNDFTPVHPFLYGILPDEEGTPLVGIAFRLEMDVLSARRSEDEEESDGESHRAQVEGVFAQFPPRRAELHFVPISAARKWLESRETFAVPVAHFDGEEWRITSDQAHGVVLRPGAILILPTLAGHHDSLSQFLEDTDDIATRDVLEGVSTQRPSYWRRVVEVQRGDHRLKSEDGACRFEPVSMPEQTQVQFRVSVSDSPPHPPPGKAWHRRLSRSFTLGTATFRFDYFKLKSQVPRHQSLDEHLERAETDGDRIARAVAPESEFLRSLLSEASAVHDVGKGNPKWQWAMGNRDVAHPVAKPVVEQPARMGGFRHEWESLLKASMSSPTPPQCLSEAEKQVWMDLWHHLIASHHGHLRPWLADRVLEAHAVRKQRQAESRLQSAVRFTGLQRLLNPWRLAYLEALLKATDVAASQSVEEDDPDEQ
ncbi:MAG: type I-U CRISPR-associated helicase/endonuclease Cas3 [Acidobacteria bacterium]|nr:type I-U CRISPR-associated helicase/endonuclease Cas3 [Acidobacteriota bacterium]